MKKLTYVLILLLSVALLAFGSLKVFQLMEKAVETPSPSATLPEATPIPSLLLLPGAGPPAVLEWETSFGDLAFRFSRTTWLAGLNDGSMFPMLDEVKTDDAGNAIFSGEESIMFSSDRAPDRVFIRIYAGDGSMILSEELDGNQLPIPDIQDEYRYEVDMAWESPGNEYRGTHSYVFNLSLDLPVEFLFDKLTVSQGDFVSIRVRNLNEDQVPVLHQGIFQRFAFFMDGRDHVGVIPAGYFTKSGSYSIEYGILGGPLEKETLTVVPYGFKTQYLFINEEIASATRNEASSVEYAKYFVPVRHQSSEERYYSEPFVIPAYGNLSTEFGETRYVNNAPTSYRHSGLDIGNVIGYPIYAVNRGRVVLSMYLISTGWTIVIDHGQGLFSVYFHMNELIAEKDEMVERGQQIGYMGTTGFSTGSHLHFTMSYYDVNIEPGYLLVGEPITKENQLLYLSDPDTP
ncbi:MAG: M23 family metallopeptidase [Clostridia bacterium]